MLWLLSVANHQARCLWNINQQAGDRQWSRVPATDQHCSRVTYSQIVHWQWNWV